MSQESSCPMALLPPGGESQAHELASGGASYDATSVPHHGVSLHDRSHSIRSDQVNSPGERNPVVQESPAVLAVLEMGFSRAAVDRARERKRRETGSDFPDAVSLFQATMEDEIDDQVSELLNENSSSVTPVPSRYGGPYISIRHRGHACESVPPVYTPQASRCRERSSRRRLSNQCWCCSRGEAVMIFLPCRHCIVCITCSWDLCSCPKCRKEILWKKRIFLS